MSSILLRTQCWGSRNCFATTLFIPYVLTDTLLWHCRENFSPGKRALIKVYCCSSTGSINIGSPLAILIPTSFSASWLGIKVSGCTFLLWISLLLKRNKSSVPILPHGHTQTFLYHSLLTFRSSTDLLAFINQVKAVWPCLPFTGMLGIWTQNFLLTQQVFLLTKLFSQPCIAFMTSSPTSLFCINYVINLGNKHLFISNKKIFYIHNKYWPTLFHIHIFLF